MRFLITLFCCTLAVMACVQGGAQSAPLSFRNPTLVSGTAKTVGAVYQFSGVLSNVNARIRIDSLVGGATIRTFDTVNIGYDAAFQPVINSLAGGNSYAVFTVSLLQTNGNPYTLSSLSATGMDIDGNANLKEWVQFDLGGGTARNYSDSAEISITPRGTGYRATNIAGKEATGIDTLGYDVMYTVTHNNVSSFTIRFGSDISGTGSNTRNFSAYMKDFVAPKGNALPLTLRSFQVSGQGGAARLQWITEDEQNTHYTQVERSLDGISFAPVAWVGAAGFSVQRRTYEFLDDLRMLDADRVFYQLRFVDRDSLYRFSRVEVLSLREQPAAEPRLYPNPTTGPLRLQLPQEWGSGPLHLTLSDGAGRLLHRETRTKAPDAALDLARLPAGLYLITVESGGRKKSLKFLKV